MKATIETLIADYEARNQKLKVLSVAELTEQGTKNGLGLKAARHLANLIWGYNLTACVVGTHFNFKRTETKVYAEYTQGSGRIMGVEYTVRVSTGNTIRSTKPKEAK